MDIKGDYGGALHWGVLQGVETFQIDSGRGSMSQEWSGVVSAELQGRVHDTSRLIPYLTTQNSKVKSHFKFITQDELKSGTMCMCTLR